MIKKKVLKHDNFLLSTFIEREFFVLHMNESGKKQLKMIYLAELYGDNYVLEKMLK